MNTANPVRVGGHQVGQGLPLYVIAGPCVLEDPDEMLATAEALAEVARGPRVDPWSSDYFRFKLFFPSIFLDFFAIFSYHVPTSLNHQPGDHP